MTDIRYYSGNQVRVALPMGDAIDAMRVAFGELSAGRVEMPQRTVVRSERDAVTLIMPGRCGVRYGLGAKIVSVFPGNRDKGKPTMHSIVVLLDEESGQPVALIDGESLTAIRTGAASGLATDLLARSDASSVAIIGSGVQARTQLEAVCAVRRIQRIAVYSRTRANAEKMAHDVRASDWLPTAEVSVVDSIAAAVVDADVICTATNTSTPVLVHGDVEKGAHVNAVGSFTPGMRELDSQLIGSAYVVVDHRPAVLAEAGEIISAIAAGVLVESDLVEIGQVVNVDAVGRTDEGQVTVFKSVGVAVQDLVAGARVLSAC